MNLAENLLGSARERPGSTAVRLGTTTCTHAELDRLTQLVAGFLSQQGVRAGGRVGVMLPNVPQFAWLYYGILRAGAVVVPMNSLLKQREVAHYLGDSGPDLVVGPDFAAEAHTGAKKAGARMVLVEPTGFLATITACDPLARVEPRAADDTAVILYTSGTTGRPKSAEPLSVRLA
jgi:long-chain acyl-CoA synthetase